MTRPALLLLAALVLGGCGSDDALRSPSDGSPAEQAPVAGQARELCAAIAREYRGQVAAAYDTTVQAVREHMEDPHDADGDPSVAPVTGAYAFPEGWAAKAPDDAAAACYVDAAIPVPLPAGAPAADRGMLMAAEGAVTFLVRAGPRATMELAPLRTPQQRVGRAEALDCGGDQRTVAMMVDHDGTVPGAATPEQAAGANLTSCQAVWNGGD